MWPAGRKETSPCPTQGVWGAGPAGPPPPGPGLGLPLHRGGCWEGQPGVFRPKPGSLGRELSEALIPNDPPVWGLGVGSAVLLTAAGPTRAALTCQPVGGAGVLGERPSVGAVGAPGAPHWAPYRAWDQGLSECG